MFERERTLYEFTLRLCQGLAADVDDVQLSHQPTPGTKPPLWVLGHLAICTDFAARLLHLPMLCPREWHAHFGRGSDNQPPKAVRPTKSELLAALEVGHVRVTAATHTADGDNFAQPHALDLFPGSPLVMRGDLLAHLMTTHEAFHLGQLSTWRRQMGFAPLF